MKTYYVYLYQNNINQKIYIGKTSNLSKRAEHHKLVAKYGVEKYKGSYSYFQTALAKYGFENFSFYIMGIFKDEQECLEKEKLWIAYFKSNNRQFGYNITEGGEGISGYKHTDETKKHLSKVMSGRTRSAKSIALSVSKTQGELSSNSKLTELQIKEIKIKYATGNYTYKQLSKEYNVSPQQLNRIVLGKRWKHLS